jgi:ABC-type nitrate/sulfonate/bicarbonate transport system substrate-binding protein
LRLAALASSLFVTQALSVEPVAATAYNLTLEPYALVVDAGRERGIFAKHGLEPRWVTRTGRAVNVNDLRELLSQGTQLGLSSPGEIFTARAQGIPIKAVAGFIGETQVKIYVPADGPAKTARDLDGRTIGPTSLAVQRQVGNFSRAYGIHAQAAPFGTFEQMLAALRQGKVDAVITAEARMLALVESGEVRILVRGGDYRPQPELNNAIWAADELIASKPDTVRRFVHAALETVQYLKDNPREAARLISARSQMPEALAYKAALDIDWMPSGQPGGDLAAAALNYWGVLQGTGTLPPETNLKLDELVDVRFVR